MSGFVIFQLFSTRVRKRPFLASTWSHAKQTSFFCASVIDWKSNLTIDSGTAAFAGASAATAHSGALDASAATPAVAAEVLRNVRRERLSATKRLRERAMTRSPAIRLGRGEAGTSD